MLKQIKLNNFKTLYKIDLTLGRLNIITGRSSSGKSTLIAFLDLMRQAAFGELTRGITRMGGFSQLVNWCADQDSVLSWQLTWEEPDLTNGNVGQYILHHRATLVPGDKGRFTIQHESLERPPYPGYTDNFKFLEGTEGNLRLLKARTNETRQGTHSLTPNELLLAQLADITHYPALWSVREQLRGWRIFSSLYFNASQMLTRPQSLDVSIPLRMEARGRNLVGVIYQLQNDVRYRPAYERFMTVLHGIAPEIDRFEVVLTPSGQGVLHYRSYLAPDKAVPTHHMSESTLRFLGYAALLVLPDLPSLIVLDAPETGIAPEHWELLATLIAQAAEHTQVLVTTSLQNFAQLGAFKQAHVLHTERNGAESTFTERHLNPSPNTISPTPLSHTHILGHASELFVQ